jgi:hypothetical protein
MLMRGRLVPMLRLSIQIGMGGDMSRLIGIWIVSEWERRRWGEEREKGDKVRLSEKRSERRNTMEWLGLWTVQYL